MGPLVNVGQIVDGLAFVNVEDRPVLGFQGVVDMGVLDDDSRRSRAADPADANVELGAGAKLALLLRYFAARSMDSTTAELP